ncbi:pirin family protein [Kitasatospora sp. NPDC056651]|uniref:pirin family protein n=1 Tax=Kitasatospora sp. NPDC056651 TaxID=3345892 RepID=UPI0036A31981
MNTPTTTTRSVATVVSPIHTREGEGFPVRRPFPTPDLAFLDPFLMVDQVGPVQLARGEAKGTPPHPHRGFETIAYVLEGDIEYADSEGHRGVVPPGAVQWLTAGSGIVHSAMPTADFLASGGRQHNLQIWVNLPSRLKGIAPRTQNHGADAIPVVRIEDGSRLKVIAGRTHGVTGPFDTHVPVLVAHATLAPQSTVRLPIAQGHNAAVYVLAGSANASGTELPDGHLGVLADDGDAVNLTGGPAGADVLFLTGEPIGEPVVRSGPFVMNAKDEIAQAYADYAAGRMGFLAR